MDFYIMSPVLSSLRSMVHSHPNSQHTIASDVFHTNNNNNIKRGASRGPSPNMTCNLPQLLFCSAIFPEDVFLILPPAIKSNAARRMRAHDRQCVLTHLDCSTRISIRTLASSFLLTKPISSSASSASTSTTGRGRASVSRSFFCVVPTGW